MLLPLIHDICARFAIQYRSIKVLLLNPIIQVVVLPEHATQRALSTLIAVDSDNDWIMANLSAKKPNSMINLYLHMATYLWSLTMVSMVSVPKPTLSKWADSLYAMGKTIQNAEFANDLLQLAREIYDERDLHANRNESSNPQTILSWMNRIKKISEGRETPVSLKSPLIDMYYSMANSLELSSERSVTEIAEHSFESQIFWESVILAFTLWYGGQSFSLQEREFETELGLNNNLHLQQALKRLQSRSILTKNERGLFLIDPDFRQNVDSALLFLVAMGVNINARAPTKRGYTTIQAAFIQFSKANHHPASYLTEGLRSYVTDYCQRLFGRIFKLMEQSNRLPDYSVLRRFITRLSLYSDFDFVVSSQKEIESTVHALESLKAITIVLDPIGQKQILLKGDLASG